MPDAASGRGFDRGGAVVGGVVVGGGEPGHIAGIANHERSHDRTHSPDLDQGGARGSYRGLDVCLVGGDLPIEAANVGEVVTCHQCALLSNRRHRPHRP